MEPDWWDINVNGSLLVTVNGKRTAEFMIKYLRKDASYKYDLEFSKKNYLEETAESEAVKPLSPADIIGNVS